MKKASFCSFKHLPCRASRQTTRPLTLETLEDRTLLATWGGFDTTPELGVYKNDGAAVIGFEEASDLIKICDVNVDGCDDIVTVNYAKSQTLVYLQDKDNLGTFSPAITSPITVDGVNVLNASGTDGFAATFGDFNADEYVDLLVVRQDEAGGSTLSLRLFAGDSDGKFALQTTSEVHLDEIGLIDESDESYLYIQAVQVGEDDVAVRLFGLTVSSTTGVKNVDITYCFYNSGDGSFPASGVKSEVFENVTDGEVLVGSTTLNGKNFLVTQKATKDVKAFNFYNTATGVVSTVSHFSESQSYSILTPAWSLVSGEFLYYAGYYTDSPSKLVVAQLSCSDQGVVTALNNANDHQVLNLDNVTFGNNTHATVGLLNNDGYTDLICVTDKNYTFFSGNSPNGLDYEQENTVITNPSFLASYVINGDLVVVGAYGIWSYKDCNLANGPTQIASFPTPALQAEFGYFGSQTIEESDDRIDIAVLFSNSVGLFAQATDGSFSSGSLSVGNVSIRYRNEIPATDKPVMAIGDFLGKGSDQIVVNYSDVNSVPYLAWIDPLAFNTDTTDGNYIPNQSFEVPDGYAISSLAAGNFGSIAAGTAGIVYAVDKDSLGSEATDSKLFFLNESGGSLAAVPTEIVLTGVEKPLCVSLANINGDSYNDVVFLDAGTGALDAALYYLLGTATGFAEPVLVGEIDEAGDVGGLALADLSGDGKLDAVFSVTKADGQSKTYVALGQEGEILFEAPAYYYLLGDSFDGIDYLPESGLKLAAPSIFVTDPVTGSGFRNLYLVKGKTVVFLESAEQVDTAGNVSFVIRGTDTQAASVAKTIDGIKEGAYDWVDEWSSFYVEIWGNVDEAGGSVAEFKSEFTFNEGYFEYGGSFEAGGIGSDKFNVLVDASESGKISVLGNFSGGISANGMILLARVKMTPVGNGSIGLDMLESNEYQFTGFTNTESFGIAAVADEQSINRSKNVEAVDTDSFSDLVVYPVRYDFNDNGSVNSDDFIDFATYFGTAPVGKHKVFDVVNIGNIDSDDFIEFANAYGVSVGMVTSRFYTKDPIQWLTSTQSFQPFESSTFVNGGVSLLQGPITEGSTGFVAVHDELLIQIDEPESEFLAIDLLDELAADQVISGTFDAFDDEILPLLWNPEVADDTPQTRSDDAPESDDQITDGLETTLN